MDFALSNGKKGIFSVASINLICTEGMVTLTVIDTVKNITVKVTQIRVNLSKLKQQ